MVSRRDASTLLPIIHAHVLPGTTIQWAAYNGVQTLPNVVTHSTVNHSLEFVNPVTGVHTQNIESYWNHVKHKFKHMKGVHLQQLPSYLDEFMWRERHGKTVSLAFQNIIKYKCPIPCLTVSQLHDIVSSTIVGKYLVRLTYYLYL